MCSGISPFTGKYTNNLYADGFAELDRRERDKFKPGASPSNVTDTEATGTSGKENPRKRQKRGVEGNILRNDTGESMLGTLGKGRDSLG